MFNRAQELKQLEPGLHAIFGQNYKLYDNEFKALFEITNSNRAFEEELLFSGFGNAPVKAEGAAIQYDDTGEGWVARYNHETIALGFAITEEAMEDNLYEPIATRLTKALARSMVNTKEVKAASIYNLAQDSSQLGGDGKVLLATDHPLRSGGTASNRPTNNVDLSQTSLENAFIDIAGFTDDRGIPAAINARSLHIARQNWAVAKKLLGTQLDPESAQNTISAVYGMLPGGWSVNHRFTDPDAWFIRTDAPDGLKHMVRKPVTTAMEGDFETGNVRYKARERYSFGWSDWRALYGSMGS